LLRRNRRRCGTFRWYHFSQLESATIAVMLARKVKAAGGAKH
jgi:hypothetical protein